MITKWGTPIFLGAITFMLSTQNVCSQSKQGQTQGFSQAAKTNPETTNNLNPSLTKNEASLQVPAQGTTDVEGNEKLVSQWNSALDETKQEAKAGTEEFNLFIRFYQNYIDSERCALFHLVNLGKINENNITPYISAKRQKLLSLYSHFLDIKKEFPTSVDQYRKNAPIVLDTCFPSCTNIDFNTGDFTGWSGFYGVNNSVTNYNITNITGGLLGPVVRGAQDPFTANSYQVHITSKANVDWFLSTFHGINMSQASPWGGNFSAMIGDSINNGAGVAILSQKFFVSPGTTNFTYQYSVFLENPNHPVFEQPFFKVALLDQNGDTIPYCGQYVVVSKATIPGFKGEYYPARNDTIYWKDWTQVNVPLSRYVGQCITIVFEVSDCEPTGHCGYAYVDASCSPLAITMPSPMLCGQKAGTLIGPAGAAQYYWTGPNGGIVGNDTLQNINIDSAGTYTLVITPVTGAQCKDTLTIKVVQDPGVKVTATSVNILCNGGNNGSIMATATGGSGAYTYSWTPSGGTNATATGLTAGKYIVMVTDSFGCSITDTVTLTQPALLTAAAATSKNILCNGGNSGIATVIAAGGIAPYTYKWNPSAQTTATATGLSVGSYTITVTDANGCIATSSTTLTQPVPLTAIAKGGNLSCFGDSSGFIIVVPNGGTGPYKYLWAPCGCTEDTVWGAKAQAYSVVVTDANGCTATAAVTITQPTVLTATPTVVNNVSCNNANNGSANITVSGGTAVYTYLWSPTNQTNATSTGLSAGNYTLTVTDAHGCLTTATTTITQPTVLSAASATSTNVSCNGLNNGSATATATGGAAPYKYLWNPSAQTNSNASGLSAGTYTVTVTDAQGCLATASTTITQPLILTANATNVSNVNCNGGGNGSANVITTGGTTAYNYLWSPSNQTNATANGLTAGTYTITVTDANGCIATSTTTITQPLLLTTAITTSTNVNCNGGNNGTATANVNGGTGPYTYLWNPTGQTVSTAIGLTAGTYTIIITDANGCTATTNTTITQPLALSATTVVSNVNCNGGNNGSVTATVSGGTGPYNYLWNPSNQTTTCASNLSAGSYTVMVTDAHGCSLTASGVITQPLILSVTLTSKDVTCNAANNGSSAATVTGGTSPYRYIWTPSAQTNAIANMLSAGTYSLTVTDTHGCTANAVVSITQPPVLSISSNTISNVSCNGGVNGSASSGAAGGTSPYTYLWFPSGQTTANANGLSAGIFTVTVTDADGCTANNSITITEPAALSMLVKSSAQSICNGQSVTLNAVVSGGTSPYTYKWSNGSTTSNITVFPTSTTTYIVVVTDAHGCTIQGSVTIAVNKPLTAIATQNPDICPGSSATLNVSASGGDGLYSYNWMPGNNTNQSITVTPSSTSTYTVIISDGCNSKPDTVYITVIVSPLPVVLFGGDVLQGCAPLCVQFRNTTTITTGNIVQWDWNFGDGSISHDKTPVHCYANPGKYTVTLTATSDNGCSASLAKINYITVFGIPTAEFTNEPQPTTIMNPLIQFTDQSSDKDGISSWYWTFGEPGDSNSSYNRNTFHNYKDTGTYRVNLIVINVHGCVDSIAHDVIINPDFTLYFPNAFSPNGDGTNDVFTAKGSYVKNFDMYIYDRWGMKLYHTNDINKGWNGKVAGGNTICQEDTYVYIATAEDTRGNTHQYTGNVTLIK